MALLGAGLASVAGGQVITESTTPTADSDPRAIVAGPDGNLWFTELGGKIRRITTAGVMTEFTVPTAGSSLLDIATGSDGNLWFTEPGGYIDKIGTHTWPVIYRKELAAFLTEIRQTR